jgi:hypothetical protein
MTFHFRSSYPLKIIITRGRFWEEYSVNSNDSSILSDQILSRFNFEFQAKKYSILNIFWNNSILNPEDNENSIIEDNHIYTRISIEGVDIDLLISSSIFILMGLILELIIRSLNYLPQIRLNKYSFNINDKSLISVLDRNNKSKIESQKQTRTFPVSRNLLYLVIKKEWERAPKYIILMLFATTYIIINPTKRLFLVNPSIYELTLSLISTFYESFKLLWILWSAIIALSGVMIWKSKIEGKELQTDFSLPIPRHFFGIASFLLMISEYFLVLILPFSVSLIISNLRFGSLVDLSIITFTFLWIYACMITISLISTTISILFSHTPFHTVFVYIMMSFGLIFTLIDIFLGNIILPLPTAMEIIYTTIIEASITLQDIFTFIGATLIVISVVFGFYIYAIRLIDLE